jgi:murein hydrolase activator
MSFRALRFTVLFALAIGLVSSAPGGAVAQELPPQRDASESSLALLALDRKMADLDAEESASKRELSDIGPKIGQAKQRSYSRARAFYRLTRAGILPVGAGFGSLISHAMRVEKMRRLLASDIDSERKLREHGGDLARGLERLARDRGAMASQRTAMDAARLAMADEIRRQQAFDGAFAKSTGTGDYVAVYGGSGATESGIGGFGASKGRLLFPVAGRAETRAVKREGTDGPGLEVRAPAGTSVRAVYAGRVAFADRYGPYGRLVIVDHGEHYYTVSGNLASIDTKVGAEVTAGERLGTVGDEGHGVMMYFEVRHRTETIVPGPWLGL